MLPLSARSPQARLCAISNIVFTDHPMAFSLLKMYFRMVSLSLPVGLLAEDPMRQEGGGKYCHPAPPAACRWDVTSEITPPP